MKLLCQGAEAIILLDGKTIIKERLCKSYRIKAIDDPLRKLRTRNEAKLLQKAEGFAPKLFDVNDKTMIIKMEYIDGVLLKDVLDTLPKKEKKLILVELGKHIATLHGKDIVHGDLTTSNIILKDNKPFLLDFGLGSISPKTESKAVDLHLLNQALTSKHYDVSKEAFAYILEGYSVFPDHELVLQRLKKVESRGRYKPK